MSNYTPGPPPSHGLPVVTIAASHLSNVFPALPNIPLPPAVLNGIRQPSSSQSSAHPPFKSEGGGKSKSHKSRSSKKVTVAQSGTNPYLEFSASTADVKMDNFDVQGQCQYCKYYSDKKDRMRRHMRTVHMGEKPFACTLCPYAAARKDKIKRHMETVHTTEKPYKCEFCSHATNRKDKIKVHVENVHLKSPRSLTPGRGASHHKKETSETASPYFPLMGVPAPESFPS